MRTVSRGHKQQGAAANSDFSAFLLGAALWAAHFFPLPQGAELRWMRCQRWRSLGVFSALLAFGGLLAAHLYVIQFDPQIAGGNLRALARRWGSYDTPQGRRGNILFRN